MNTVLWQFIVASCVGGLLYALIEHNIGRIIDYIKKRKPK